MGCKITESDSCRFEIDLDGNGKADAVVVRNLENETEVSVKMNGGQDETVLYRSSPLEKEASLKSQWLSLTGASNGVGVRFHIVNFFRKVTGFKS